MQAGASVALGRLVNPIKFHIDIIIKAFYVSGKQALAFVIDQDFVFGGYIDPRVNTGDLVFKDWFGFLSSMMLEVVDFCFILQQHLATSKWQVHYTISIEL